ncbi:MAG: BON domain-containing protein [Verrucomicrobiota bacterium]|jgi:hyperosmotically inducible periplasmic protein
MKIFFIGLIVGAVLMAVTGWYFVTVRHLPAVQHAQDATVSTLRQTADAIETKLVAWHLTGTDIEAELAKTGKVVRRQMREFGASIADTTSDARISAQIKGKFALTKELSAKSISVSTTDGRVTLSGIVANSKLIGKAMALALETDGVREVSSTLKVK